MDNKSEKTFADLFSNSKEEQDNKITFDNLSSKTSKNENSSFTDILNKEQEELNPFKEAVNEEKTIETEEQEELNPFKEAANEEKAIETEEQEELNPFKEAVNEEKAIETEEQEELNPFKEAVNEEKATEVEEQEEQNPFKEAANEEKTIETEEQEELNPFKEAANEEKTIETEEQEELNPFKEAANEEKATEIEEHEEQYFENDFNPFIGQKEEKSTEEPPIKIEKEQENITEQEEQNSSKTISDKPSDKIEEEKSVSPFFESDKVDDNNNPFFERTLSLMENKNFKDNKSKMINAENSQHYHVKIVRKKEPLLKLIIGVLSYALFIWLLLIGITLLVYVLDIKIRAAKGDYSTPTYNAYVVLTGSMLPEIQVYDVVITKKTQPKDLNKGDVITFSSADSRFLGTIITHRIINKTYDAKNNAYTFQTKGDNNNVADNALVPQNNIYGKVILKIPKLGYLQEFLASRGGWIIVILIPCLTVLSYDIVKLAKGLKKKKYKNIKVQK